MSRPNRRSMALTCPVCLDLADQAVEARCCGKIFCQRCIGSPGNHCPNCKHEELVYRPSLVARREIVALRSGDCPFMCGDRVIQEHIDAHVLICKNRLFTCPDKTCRFSGKKSAFGEHILHCHQDWLIENINCIFNLQQDVEEKPTTTHQEDAYLLGESSSLARQIAKRRVLRDSELVESGVPSIYKLEMREEHVDNHRKLRKVTYGSPKCYKPMKIILVVGATGAGKSTLINTLANYILGVSFDDGYRFRIIEENRDANQAKSQTKWVTAYVFYHQANFPAEFPCSLTIIDTPGFGDTDGIAADEKITQQLKEYFHGKGDAGIDALDAIGFVVQASCARLTPTQQYIFDSILALFGRDVEENIFALATFADGQKAPVMQALDEAKMPYTQSFKFNNSALFADRTPSAGGDKNEQDFDRSFWAMGVHSYKKFLSHVARAQPKSLVLTNQVMDERQHLQARVSGLQTQIKVATTKIESLRSSLDCFRQHQTDIERNRDFEFEVQQSKIVHIVLEQGTYVTNCLTCNRTCHYPCNINDDGQKWRCAAMKSQEDQNTTCTVCEKACHWTMHRNMPERLEVQTEVIRQTVSEMKKEYEQAWQQQLSTADVIVKIIEDIEYSETEIACLVNEVRNSLQRLNEIALRPDHMTTVGYIDILIRSEKQQALDGWQSRVRQLENVRERAKLINSYSQFHNISEPYRDLKTEIMQRKKGRKEGRQEGTGVVQALKGFRDRTVAGVKNLVG